MAPFLRAIFFISMILPADSVGGEVTFDPLFMDRPAEAFAKYTFEKDGTISGGPRAAPEESIDSSFLWKTDVLGVIFAQSILTCVEGIRYCEPIPRIWPARDLPLKVVTERDSMGRDEISLLVESLAQTLGTLGFAVPSEPDIDRARIVIYAGSFDYLAFKVMQLSDEYGVRFYNEWKTERGGKFSQDE